MNDNLRETLYVVGGAVVAVLLQIILAPNIRLFGAMPNIILAYALCVAVLRPGGAGPVFAFVLGLMYDLLGSAPVGAMAFLLVLATFVIARAFSVLNNDTAFMPLVLIAIVCAAVEVLYALFMLAFGVPAGLGEALMFRVLPCALYDCAAAFLLFPLVSLLISRGAQYDAGMPRLR